MAMPDENELQTLPALAKCMPGRKTTEVPRLATCRSFRKRRRFLALGQTGGTESPAKQGSCPWILIQTGEFNARPRDDSDEGRRPISLYGGIP